MNNNTFRLAPSDGNTRFVMAILPSAISGLKSEKYLAVAQDESITAAQSATNDTNEKRFIITDRI